MRNRQQPTLHASGEVGMLLLSIIIVAVLAVIFDAAIAEIGWQNIWPVTYTHLSVIIPAALVAWLVSLLARL